MSAHHDLWVRIGNVLDVAKDWAVTAFVVLVIAALIVGGAFLLFGSEV